MRWKVVNEIDCSKNKIVDLTGFPESTGSAHCNFNKKLQSLKGVTKIHISLYVSMCPNLKSLEYCPETLINNFDISRSGIESLDHCPKTVGHFYAQGYNGKFTIKQIREKCNVTETVSV